ncbi:Rpn family recombination-promoting nuclease/putative transposase [Parabacteroides massiliensis]|uniref:Rpn family recombination-promoting nuclease/putative transposase n=1 Tax=Parabacteroides massiliensis TaxID=1750560 RepID=UPI00096A9EB1|nr:Rpn family recombination-promoting nuclease/putative transposase [Parabacteroides massiliensis]
MKKEESDLKIMEEMERRELQDRYIRFDWAIKRLLRQKANFGVLEGFLTVMIGEEVKILEILESEGNQTAFDDKFNRVDVKALNSKGEIIIVEVQNTRELYYLERILYGVAKAITEHISLGESYQKVKKVYSISILYFDLGVGTDYFYHGQNHFIGVHTGDQLRINTRDRDAVIPRLPAEIFPEYILIRVNEFDKVASTPLDEWIEYLKDGTIRPDTTVPGLREAREKLKYDSMTRGERYAYEEHLTNVVILEDAIENAKWEGLTEGKAEGLAEGETKAMRQAATNMKQMGMDAVAISNCTGLTADEIEKL